jgi:hypothetical protein
MTHEEQRELRVLSDAEAPTVLSRYYSFKDEPKMATTARRLGREPVPNLIQVSEGSASAGPAIVVASIKESGKARLRELRSRL